MEKWVSKLLEMHSRDKDFKERGVQSPLSYSAHVASCAVSSNLWLFCWTTFLFDLALSSIEK